MALSFFLADPYKLKTRHHAGFPVSFLVISSLFLFSISFLHSISLTVYQICGYIYFILFPMAAWIILFGVRSRVLLSLQMNLGKGRSPMRGWIGDDLQMWSCYGTVAVKFVQQL